MHENEKGGGSTRFKKGQSGNPRGRPRNVKVRETDSAFDVLEDLDITGRLPGLNRNLTVEEALLHRTYQDALGGKPKEVRKILSLIIAREATGARKHRVFPSFHAEWPKPADIDEALLILGIASRSADHDRPGERSFLQLQPWAANSSLKRKKRPRLTRKDVQELKGATSDPEAVDWPCGDDE